ncbi:hypothetical protein DL96DRAFT_1559229 [Flagelloscypha sp. PMI_526]|nr:hypothetical protein DL96DRAFT_1559229 [Flagelloscypha sp. PMI_526]
MSDKTSQDTERRDYGTCIGYKRSQFVFPRQFPAESEFRFSFHSDLMLWYSLTLGCRKHSRSAPEIGPFEFLHFQFKTGTIHLCSRLQLVIPQSDPPSSFNSQTVAFSLGHYPRKNPLNAHTDEASRKDSTIVVMAFGEIVFESCVWAIESESKTL